MRPRNIVITGAVIGFGVAIVVFIIERLSLAHAANLPGIGFGVSHLLFALSLPWSAGIVAVMWSVLTAFGVDGPNAMRPFFYAMPLVAGIAWSALIATIVDYRRLRRRSSRPSVKPR
jgi:hypothetical protein